MGGEGLVDVEWGVAEAEEVAVGGGHGGEGGLEKDGVDGEGGDGEGWVFDPVDDFAGLFGDGELGAEGGDGGEHFCFVHGGVVKAERFYGLGPEADVFIGTAGEWDF